MAVVDLVVMVVAEHTNQKPIMIELIIILLVEEVEDMEVMAEKLVYMDMLEVEIGNMLLLLEVVEDMVETVELAFISMIVIIHLKMALAVVEDTENQLKEVVALVVVEDTMDVEEMVKRTMEEVEGVMEMEEIMVAPNLDGAVVEHQNKVEIVVFA